MPGLTLEVDGELKRLMRFVSQRKYQPNGPFVVVAVEITDKRLLGPVKMTDQVVEHIVNIIRNLSLESNLGLLLNEILQSRNSPVRLVSSYIDSSLRDVLNRGLAGDRRFSALVHGGQVQLWVRQR